MAPGEGGSRRRQGCGWALLALGGLVVGCVAVGLVGVVLLARSLESVTWTATGCQASEVAAIRAAAVGDLTEVQRHLDDGWEVAERDAAGNTALACAGPPGHVAVVRLLLERGADPDTVARDRDHVLADAARFCQPEVAAALLAAGAPPDATDRSGRPALEQAVAHADLATVQALLAGGADPVLVGQPRVVADRSAFSDERGPACGSRTDLAVQEAVLAVLLSAGATPEAVLDRAAAVGAPQAAAAALAAGADPDVGYELLRTGGTVCGWLPPADAAALGFDACGEEVVAALSSRVGPDVPVDPDLPVGWVRRPPLLSAAWRGDGAMVELLLAAGADPNAASTPGFTALHAAAGHGLVEYQLVAAGAVAPPGVPTPDQLRRLPQSASTTTTLR